MSLSHFRSKFYGLFCYPRGLVASFNSQIEAGNREQTFRVGAKLRLYNLSCFESRDSFATEIEVQRDLRNHPREQIFRNTRIRLVDCEH